MIISAMEPMSGCRMSERGSVSRGRDFYRSPEVESGDVCPYLCYQDDRCVYVTSAYVDLQLGTGPVWLCLLFEEGTYIETPTQDVTQSFSWKKDCEQPGMCLHCLVFSCFLFLFYIFNGC